MKNITFEEAQKLVEQGELATAEERKILQKERLHILVDYARENLPGADRRRRSDPHVRPHPSAGALPGGEIGRAHV